MSKVYTQDEIDGAVEDLRVQYYGSIIGKYYGLSDLAFEAVMHPSITYNRDAVGLLEAAQLLEEGWIPGVNDADHIQEELL